MWQGPYRWVSTMLLVIVGFIAFNALFRALDANPENLVAAFVGVVAGLFLLPFRDLFAADQAYLLTALMAILSYALLAAIIVSATQTIEVARRGRDAARARRVAASAPRARRGAAAEGLAQENGEQPTAAASAPRLELPASPEPRESPPDEPSPAPGRQPQS
ncbi:MAG TPA: hypothetical protein VML96_00205 [Egibacteraceae bacterium]|nr:hypothetical protein [Egibacteraceae bacterium]